MIPPILRAAARAASGAGLTAAWLVAAELDVARHRAPERPDVFDRHTRRWARTMLRVMGVRTVVAPGPPVLATGPRLVVANHRTTLDVLVILSLFGGQFLSRTDVADWPLIGRGARRARVVFVDREDGSSGARAIRTIRRLLREGRTVTVFPEGTTFPGDEVRPFHAGAFAAARGLDVTLQPVGLAYPAGTEWYGDTFAAHAGKLARRRETTVGVCLGEPRPSRGAGAAEVAESLRAEVQDLTDRARRLIP